MSDYKTKQRQGSRYPRLWIVPKRARKGEIGEFSTYDGKRYIPAFTPEGIFAGFRRASRIPGIG